MKSLFLSLLLLMGWVAQADVPGYKKVPEDKIETYQRAVEAAIMRNPDAISACDRAWVHNTQQAVSEILVKEDNGQPLLLFNAYFFEEDRTMHRLVFFTTPDLKNLTKVHAEIYEKGEVNSGDLANPVITYDYILKGRWDCSQPHH